jgi:hypothetical protein
MDTAGATVTATPAWRRLLPFVVALCLIAFVVTRVDYNAFVTSIARTNLVGFFAFTIVFSLVLIVADCLASVHVYRLLVGEVSFRELVVLRGASYLPGLLNHNVGQAWLTYAIARACKTSIIQVASATLLVYASTLACVFALAATSIVLAPDRFSWLPGLVLAASAAAVAYVAVLAVRPQWFTEAPLTSPLARAGVRGHVLATIARIPHVAVLFTGSWLPFWFFGIDIPLADALALIPPLMVLVALPITPQSIGTRDAFAVQVFAVYAAGTQPERIAAVAAATLSWAVALTFAQLPLSLIFMRIAARRGA